MISKLLMGYVPIYFLEYAFRVRVRLNPISHQPIKKEHEIALDLMFLIRYLCSNGFDTALDEFERSFCFMDDLCY